MTISIAEIMQQMIDAGAPINAVMIAVKAIEEVKSSLESQIEHNRATTRERVKKHRENKRLSECNVTETILKRDSNVTVTSRVDAPACSNTLSSEPKGSSEVKEERKKETRVTALVVSPETELIESGVDPETLKAWKGVRKEKRAGPISKPVVDALRRESSKAGISMQQAVTICCERGWQGFKADWLIGSRNNGPPPKARTVSELATQILNGTADERDYQFTGFGNQNHPTRFDDFDEPPRHIAIAHQ